MSQGLGAEWNGLYITGAAAVLQTTALLFSSHVKYQIAKTIIFDHVYH